MLFLIYLFWLLSLCNSQGRPNILFIIADDLGWNDVGFHGSNQIPTPNIDALAGAGLMLHNYYVTPICTPSRAALMTGKYPIHTGMQHTVLYEAEPRGLPLSEKILPEYLKELGYATHLVGKWHLGFYKSEYLPMNRGFDSHLGFWTGKIDMYDHTNQVESMWGFDFRRGRFYHQFGTLSSTKKNWQETQRLLLSRMLTIWGYSVAHDVYGRYATDVYTEEAVKIINCHDVSQPLFLMVSHSAVHSGNPYEFLRAPEHLLENFTYIDNFQRRKFAAILTKLDESVGTVVAALESKGLLENSIVVFTTDNGGPAEGFNNNAASNFPLRGVKNTLWEGGVRGAGLIWSQLIEKRSRVAKQRVHLVDWLPTLLRAAGANISTPRHIDGIDQWDALSKDLDSPRTSIVHNIDDIYGNAAITLGKWKLHKGTNYQGVWDFWYGPDGRNGSYNVDLVQTSLAGRALSRIGTMPTNEKILELRDEATINCERKNEIACKPLEAPCLFDVEEDPCEMRNLANIEPEILAQLLQELDKVNRTVVPPTNKPNDPLGNPMYWGYAYTNFGDYRNPSLNIEY